MHINRGDNLYMLEWEGERKCVFLSKVGWESNEMVNWLHIIIQLCIITILTWKNNKKWIQFTHTRCIEGVNPLQFI